MPTKDKKLIKKEATYNPSKDLFHGATVLLKHTTEDKVDGSYYSLMSSLVLLAFSVEAFLNKVGEIIEPKWKADFDRNPIFKKLKYINNLLKNETDFGRAPLQDINKLFEFRNDLAHGWEENVSKSVKINTDSYTVNDIYSPPVPIRMEELIKVPEVIKMIDSVGKYKESVVSKLNGKQLVEFYNDSGSGSVEPVVPKKSYYKGFDSTS